MDIVSLRPTYSNVLKEVQNKRDISEDRKNKQIDEHRNYIKKKSQPTHKSGSYALEAFNGSNNGNRSAYSNAPQDDGIEDSFDFRRRSHRSIVTENSNRGDDEWTTVDSRRRQEQRNRYTHLRKKGQISGTRKADTNGFKAANKVLELFIGRVDLNVTMENIKNYVRETFNVNINSIEKLEVKTTRHNAYKMLIETNDLKNIYNAESWPENIIVHKFFNKRVQ